MDRRLVSSLLAGIVYSCLGLQSLPAQATVPIGQITATPPVVQAGAKPQLSWSITTPTTVKDLIAVSATGSLTASRNLTGEVRVLGAGISSQYPNGGTQYYQTMCQMKIGSSSNWTTLFDGLHTDPLVQSLGVAKNFTVNTAQGNTIHLSARFKANNVWYSSRSTISGNYFIALKNGDACPAVIPDFTSPHLKEFLKPYLDASNKVKIGPMDLIVFIELTHINPADAGFDGQDLVLLITFQAP